MTSMDELVARLTQLETVATASIDRAQRAEAALQNVMCQVGQMQQAAAAGPQQQVYHAPPPPPFALVDTRQLGKPKSFNGTDGACRKNQVLALRLRGSRRAAHGRAHGELARR